MAPLVAAVLALAAADAESKGSLADEPFVVERLSHRYRFESDGAGELRSTARVRIQTDAGVQAHGLMPFPYDPSRHRLELTMRVVKPDGSAAPVPPEAIHEVTAAVAREAPVYSDARERHVTVPGLRPGDVLEWDARMAILRPSFPGHFWLFHDFKRGAIVEEETLEIDVPSDRRVARRWWGAAGEPQIGEAGRRRTLRWRHSVTTLDEARRWRESAARPRLTIARGQGGPPDVEVGTFRGWEELGDVWGALALPRAEPTAEVRAKAAELTRGAASDREKVRALYEFVSREIRYVAIHLGRGGYQPRFAAKTLAAGYGDCKDKHTLLAALQRSLGIEASPVLVSTSSMLTAVADPGLADHLFTRVRLGSELLWLDATPLAPFGYLAPQLRGKNALVVSVGGDEALRGAAESLRQALRPFPFPDARPIRLVRRALVSCSERRECALELPARRAPSS